MPDDPRGESGFDPARQPFGGRARQQVGLPPAGHEASAAAAHAEPAAFGALQQHDTDKADGNEQVDDQNDGRHNREFLDRC